MQFTLAGLLGSVLLLVTAGAALVMVRGARGRLRPVSVLAIVAITVGTAAYVLRTYVVDDFLRWLQPNGYVVPAVVFVGAAAVGVGVSRRGWPKLQATWLALSIAFIGVATLPERYMEVRGPRPALAERLTACVSSAGRYVPLSWSDVVNDAAPNALLYMPLGLVLGARSIPWRRRLFMAVGYSAATEIYQAVFTARVCAPRDVAANMLGILLGAAVVAVLARRAE